MFTEAEKEAILEGLSYLEVVVDEVSGHGLELGRKDIEELRDKIEFDVIPCPRCDIGQMMEVDIKNIDEGYAEYTCDKCNTLVQILTSEEVGAVDIQVCEPAGVKEG